MLLRGTVTDSSGKAIPFCGIQNLSDQSGTTADSAGAYSLLTGTKIHLRVSAIGYQSQQKQLQVNANADTTIVMNFVLHPEEHVLQAVSITAAHTPELLAEANTLLDFETYDNELCVLYETKHGEKIDVKDLNGKALENFRIHNSSTDLHKTEHGFLYSIVGDSAFVYQWDSAWKFEQFSVPEDTFAHVALSIAAFHYPCYYYLVDTMLHSHELYYYHNVQTGKNGMLYTSANEKMFQWNAGLHGSINALMNSSDMSYGGSFASVNASMNQRNITGAHLSSQLRMLQDSHCELKVVRDSLYLFNFDLDSIYVFGPANIKVRSMPLQFDLFGMQYKYKMMVTDEEKKNCYFCYQLNGITHLDLIDLNSGKRIGSFTLDGFPYVEKFRITEDRIYFTFLQNGDGIPKRRLYRVELN